MEDKKVDLNVGIMITKEKFKGTAKESFMFTMQSQLDLPPEERLEELKNLKSLDELFPIGITLPCKCTHIIKNEDEMENLKCEHGNYFVKVE